MSAIGQGVTLICGNQLDGYAGTPAPAGVRDAMVPVTLAFGDQVTLSHFVGRKAWQIIVTDDDGNVQPASAFPAQQVLQARPAPDLVQVWNLSGINKNVFIAIRWQENSTEAALFPIGSMNDEQRDRTSTVGNATATVTYVTPPNNG